METRKLLIVIAILIAIILTLVAALPGARQFLEDGAAMFAQAITGLLNLALIAIVLLGPLVSGVAIYKGIQKLDDDDPSDDLTGWQTAILAILSGLIVGLAQTLTVYYAAANPAVAGLFNNFDHEFHGFETPSAGWGVYGMVSALAIFAIIWIGKKLNF